jgi:hypothetical protein
MSKADRPVHGWNEENEPGFAVIMEMIPVRDYDLVPSWAIDAGTD